MASRSDIEAGSAFIRLFIKDAELVKSLNGVMGQCTQVARGLAVVGVAGLAAGTAIAAGLGAALAQFVSVGSALDNMAKRTGASVTMLGQLEWAANRAGVSMASIESALASLATSGRDPNTFVPILRSLASIDNAGMRLRRLNEIFGGAGKDLIPLLDRLDQYLREAEQAGVFLSPEDTRAARQLADSWRLIQASIRGTVVQLGAALAPAMQAILDTVQPIVAAVAQWIAANRELVVAIAAITAGVLLVGGGVASLVAGFLAIGGLVAGLVGAFAAITTTTGAIVASLIAAVFYGGLLVAASLALSRTLRQFVTWFGREIMSLGRNLSELFDPVLKFLRAGHIEKAWQAMANTMEAIWLRMMNNVLETIGPMAALMAGLSGNPTIIGGVVGSVAGTMAATENRIKELVAEGAKLRMEAGALDLNDPNNPNYGLGELRSKVIGFSGWAAAMAGNVVGMAGEDPAIAVFRDAIEEIREVKKALDPLKGMLDLMRDFGRFA